MRRAAVTAALALTVSVAGCAAPPTQTGWLDRPHIDSGCDAAGWCRLRGELAFDGEGAAILALEDGRRLAAAVPAEVLERPGRWDGKRVAVRGRLRSDGVLDVARLSLKGTR